MRFFRALLSVLALFIVYSASCIAEPVNGNDYLTLLPAQSTESGKKVEVVEFFAYYCPHCNALEQPLLNWVKSQGDNIVFKRIHTSVTGEATPQQRLFYTLEIMGKLGEFHEKIFHAIHVEKLPLNTFDDIYGFIVQHGIDKQKFVEVYNSFSVQTKVNNALRMQATYPIHAWPSIVVDGRYVTSPPIAGSKMPIYNEVEAQDLMLNVLTSLVNQQHKIRNQAAP